jgi:hypothetical protein
MAFYDTGFTIRLLDIDGPYRIPNNRAIVKPVKFAQEFWFKVITVIDRRRPAPNRLLRTSLAMPTSGYAALVVPNQAIVAVGVMGRFWVVLVGSR